MREGGIVCVCVCVPMDIAKEIGVHEMHCQMQETLTILLAVEPLSSLGYFPESNTLPVAFGC